MNNGVNNVEAQAEAEAPHRAVDAESIVRNVSESLRRAATELEDREEKVRRMEIALKKQEDLMEENRRKATNRITLNIRGQLFSTTKQALLRFENSFFSAMLAHGHWQPDADGTYFIDRNPEHFGRILDYLVDGELDARALDKYAQNKLEKDLEFYLLPTPADWYFRAEPMLSWDMEFCGTGLQVSGSNKTVKKTGPTGWNAAVMGTHSVTQFSVRVNTRGPNGYIMVGFAPRFNFKPNGQNYNTCGYYLNLSSGGLYSAHGQNNAAYAKPPFNEGDVVTARYDLRTKQISFSRNDQDLGVAYNDVPEGLFPATEFYETNASISLCE